MQDIDERVTLSARDDVGVVALTAIRPGLGRAFNDEEVGAMMDACELVLPMLARHIGLRRQQEQVIAALSSLPAIEATLAAARQLPMPPRERQVAARLLYGLSASAIASDLGISKETVLSYRKRIYHRLGIGCHRELLFWYLRLYNAVEDTTGPSGIARPLCS